MLGSQGHALPVKNAQSPLGGFIFAESNNKTSRVGNFASGGHILLHIVFEKPTEELGITSC